MGPFPGLGLQEPNTGKGVITMLTMFTIPYNTTLFIVAVIVFGVVGFVIYGLIRGFENVFREECQAAEQNSQTIQETRTDNPGSAHGRIPTRKEILQLMEELKEGQCLTFSLPETFGGGFARIQRNAGDIPKAKKWVLKVSKQMEALDGSRPYWSHEKPKPIAKWVNDRLGTLLKL